MIDVVQSLASPVEGEVLLVREVEEGLQEEGVVGVPLEEGVVQEQQGEC